MAIETLSGVPSVVVAGDSVQWQETLADYDQSAGWEVTTVFRGQDGEPRSFAASGASTVWTTTINAPETSAWPAGRYLWSMVAKKGQDRVRFASGSMLVRPDPEGRRDPTENESNLAAIRAALKARYAGDKPERSTIGGVSIDKTTTAELEAMRDKYVVLVRREKERDRRLSGMRSSRTTRTVFTG